MTRSCKKQTHSLNCQKILFSNAFISLANRILPLNQKCNKQNIKQNVDIRVSTFNVDFALTFFFILYLNLQYDYGLARPNLKHSSSC